MGVRTSSIKTLKKSISSQNRHNIITHSVISLRKNKKMRDHKTKSFIHSLVIVIDSWENNTILCYVSLSLIHPCESVYIISDLHKSFLLNNLEKICQHRVCVRVGESMHVFGSKRNLSWYFFPDKHHHMDLLNKHSFIRICANPQIY